MIPFGWLPGHWGLKGKTRERARIEYEYDSDPKMKEYHLLNLEYEGDEQKKKYLQWKLKHNEMTQAEYDDAIVEFEVDEESKQKKALELLLKRGEITELEYSKEMATIAKIKWFHIDVDWVDGSLEIITDWNQYFIKYLRDNGYHGTEDYEVIDAYVRDFGRNLHKDDDDSFTDLDPALDYVTRTPLDDDSNGFADYK